MILVNSHPLSLLYWVAGFHVGSVVDSIRCRANSGNLAKAGCMTRLAFDNLNYNVVMLMASLAFNGKATAARPEGRWI